MSNALLGDAFALHVWAALRLLDACAALSPEQLAKTVPGTYGSIIETVRHIVDSDAWDLFVASRERTNPINGRGMGLPELRRAMEVNGEGWSRLLAEDLDPDTILEEVDPDDGFRRSTPLGMQLAQALHHGSDHRSQLCTALTALGLKPPSVDVWSFGVQTGRVTETYPSS